MSSPQDREVTQQHVAAVLQRDGFVADARRFGSRGVVALAAAEPFAPDEASSNDGDVVQVFAPDEAVVKMGMAEVLVTIGGRVGLGRVVAAACSALHGFGGDNDRSGLKVERDSAPEMNGIGKIGAGREANSAAAGDAGRLDGAVDSRRVVRLAVSGGAMLTDIKGRGAGCAAMECALGIRIRQNGCSCKASNGGMPEKSSAIVKH